MSWRETNPFRQSGAQGLVSSLARPCAFKRTCADKPVPQGLNPIPCMKDYPALKRCIMEKTFYRRVLASLKRLTRPGPAFISEASRRNVFCKARRALSSMAQVYDHLSRLPPETPVTPALRQRSVNLFQEMSLQLRELRMDRACKAVLSRHPAFNRQLRQLEKRVNHLALRVLRDIKIAERNAAPLPDAFFEDVVPLRETFEVMRQAAESDARGICPEAYKA